MSHIDSIKSKIETELQPVFLEIINESHLHAGHQESFDGTGETHLRIRVASPMFEGKSRVERHRLINQLVMDEIDEGLHAIAIEARTPEEHSVSG